LLWTGTAANYTDLNPSGFTSSYATSTSGGQQVGSGYGPSTGGKDHALLWAGAADGYVDLNPNGFDSTDCNFTNGYSQVGYGTILGVQHALLWSGTAASYVDLSQFLPSGFSDGCAEAIDSNGDIVGYATDNLGNEHGFLWAPVPEPATLSVLSLGILIGAKRPGARRRRSRGLEESR
jgi:probable HAF family extracellular repeat protein